MEAWIPPPYSSASDVPGLLKAPCPPAAFTRFPRLLLHLEIDEAAVFDSEDLIDDREDHLQYTVARGMLFP